MKRNLKKQIKQDELVTWFEKGRKAVDEHAQQVRVGLVVLAVVAVAAGALAYFRSQRDKEARTAFAAAMESFHAPLTTEAGLSPAAGAQFATPTEKYRHVLGLLEALSRRYGSHPLADRARYYSALCHIELGQLNEAESLLKSVAAQKDDERLEPALARLTLADVQRQKGEIDQAADSYKQVVDDANAAVPRDHALMRLAQLLENAQRLDEAEAAYTRLTREFPESAYAGEAQRRIEYLKARG